MKYTVSKDGLKWLIAKIKSSLANKADKADGIIYSGADDGASADVQSVAEEVLKKVYPVGAVYIGTSSANPHTIFGFGTWVQIKDRFLLAAGDSYTAGSTGGEAAVALTAANNGPHKHTNCAYNKNNENTTSGLSGTGYFAKNTILWSDGTVTTAGGTTGDPIGITYSSGNGTPHNNMPPYLTVYMWQRTA